MYQFTGMHRLAIIIGFLLLSYSGFSQELGIFATINNSTLEGDSPKGFKIVPEYSYELGLLLDFKISEHVRLSASPSYFSVESTARVRDRTSPDRKLKDSLSVRVAYLNFPIIFKINFQENDRLYFVTGLETAINLDSDIKNLSDVPDPDDVPSIDFKDVAFNVSFGLGYRIPIKSNFLFVELRYNQGLTNVTEFTNNSNLLSRMKLQGMEWNVGYVIPLGKKDD